MSQAHFPGTRRILTHPPTVLLLLLVVQTGLALMPSLRGDFPWSVQFLGGLLIIGGIALNIAATGRFQRHGTSVNPKAPPASLVTSGVFAISRNPMYLGIAMIMVGTSFALRTPWALIVLPLYVAWITPLIRWEEQRLDALFGGRYQSYQTRVRRWL